MSVEDWWDCPKCGAVSPPGDHTPEQLAAIHECPTSHEPMLNPRGVFNRAERGFLVERAGVDPELLTPRARDDALALIDRDSRGWRLWWNVTRSRLAVLRNQR